MPSPIALASIWLLYMAGMGLVFPFQTLYLGENAGLTGTQVGLVLAIRPLVAIFAQPFWGQIADRTGSRSRVLAAVTFGTAVAHLVFPSAHGFVALLAAMAFLSLFMTSVFPMSTSVTMACLGERASERFGSIRVWGTIGYAVMVLGFPFVIDRVQATRAWVGDPEGVSEPGLGLIFYVAAVFSFAAGLVAWRLPASGALSVRSARGDVRGLLRHRPYRRALLFTFAAFFFLHGPIMFFPLFIREHGGSLDTVSQMWFPMLLAEIPLILLAGRFIDRMGVRGLLTVGVVADGLRWTVCALFPQLPVIFVMALLHGVSVAGLLMGIQLYVEQVVPARLRSSGQGVLAMAGFSAGGIGSSAVAGWLLEHVGTDAPYLFGGMAAIALGLSTHLLLPRPSRPEEASGEATSLRSP